MGYEKHTVFVMVLMNLFVGSSISMVLNLFGVMPKADWLNSWYFGRGALSVSQRGGV